MTEKLALVCEGIHDQVIGKALVERILREDIRWYEGNEDYLREWYRKDDHEALYWKEIKDRLRFHGSRHRFRGLPHAHGDGLAAERAMYIIEFDYSRNACMIFLRDCDGQPERFAAIDHVRKQYPDRTVVIGFAVDRIEAWILAAFEPKNQDEASALEKEKTSLGFDPTCKPHELTAKTERGKTNPKRVLQSLLAFRGSNRYIYEEMMNTTAWECFNRKGTACGILSFCRDVRERLIPLFQNQPEK